MDQQTREGLTTAEENHQIAQSLLALRGSGNARYRWVAIASFYAAVHYVNAYIWELQRIEPHDHHERAMFVGSVADLKAIDQSYVRLQDRGYRARYRPNFQIGEQDARDLLDNHLEAVRTAVMKALSGRR